jgi:LPS export ABC transporter protein LptC
VTFKWSRVRIRNTGAFILLVLVTLLWLNYDSPGIDPKLTESARQTRADYFLEQADMQIFAADGSLLQRLQADKLEFFAARGQSSLFNPKVTQSQGNNNVWKIAAPRGLLDNNKQQLEFNGEVIISAGTSSMPRQTGQERIQTYDLVFDFAKKQAQTDAPVEIIAPSMVTRGKGFTIDFTKQTISIRSEVETYFAISSH